jgi:hypothetical protein
MIFAGRSAAGDAAVSARSIGALVSARTATMVDPNKEMNFQDDW